MPTNTITHELVRPPTLKELDGSLMSDPECPVARFDVAFKVKPVEEVPANAERRLWVTLSYLPTLAVVVTCLRRLDPHDTGDWWHVEGELKDSHRLYGRVVTFTVDFNLQTHLNNGIKLTYGARWGTR